MYQKCHLEVGTLQTKEGVKERNKRRKEEEGGVNGENLNSPSIHWTVDNNNIQHSTPTHSEEH